VADAEDALTASAETELAVRDVSRQTDMVVRVDVMLDGQLDAAADARFFIY